MDGINGVYPIIIDGEKTGELVVSQEGTMTFFHAACRETGSVLRLSVYGDGEGYLGVMQPEGGKYVLRKRLTRAELRNFPRSITHAGEAGKQKSETKENVKIPPEIKREKVSKTEDEPGIDWQEMPNPWMLFADPDMKKTFQKCKGVLISKQDDKLLLAIPLLGNTSFPALPVYSGGETRVIVGKQYAVFELKNGKII